MYKSIFRVLDANSICKKIKWHYCHLNFNYNQIFDRKKYKNYNRISILITITTLLSCLREKVELYKRHYDMIIMTLLFIILCYNVIKSSSAYFTLHMFISNNTHIIQYLIQIFYVSEWNVFYRITFIQK